MFRNFRLGYLKALCFIWLSWSCAAWAISLGSPQLQSRPGEPLRVEIPIRLAAEDSGALDSLKVVLPTKAAYERLGISSQILDLNPQSMVYRNRAEQLMILVETVDSVPITDDPFVDLLVNLNWSSGSITKAFTLLIGDAQRITVKPGQTLSEIAAIMAPQLDGATLDQAMMALYKANPDAFASGSINQLAAGAELKKPSQALLRSISPAEANQFVAEANAQWRADQGNVASGKGSQTAVDKSSESAPKDRLKIGSSADSNEERRYTEELVAQEKQLEQAKARVAELEKNIADLQRLLDKSKENKALDSNFGLGAAGPAILAIGLIALTGLLLWFFARNARRSESYDFEPVAHQNRPPKSGSSHLEMPERTKALFAKIDLELAKPAEAYKTSPEKVAPEQVTSEPSSSPLADTLRVKLNLVRAYITIEDFSAAKKSIEEVLLVSNSVDPAITIEAQGLLAELTHRNV